VPHTSAHREGPDPVELLSVSSLPGTRTGQVVVEVIGEVDTYTAPVLDLCLRSQVRPGFREVVVDLRGVTFLGTAGITGLAGARQRYRMLGAGLVIRAGGRRNVLHSLEQTGLADVVAVEPGAHQLRTNGMPPGRRSDVRRSGDS
jgi:anti-sigma B factor antagonist